MPLVKLTQCESPTGTVIRDVWVNSDHVIWVSRNSTMSFIQCVDGQTVNVLETPEVIVPAMNPSIGPAPTRDPNEARPKD